jgi:uncharacterized protein YqhQ
MMKKEKLTRTYIGGQAVMEGVMLKGKTAYATAVRDPEGKVQVESKRIDPPEKQKKWLRAPFIRGVVSFIQSLLLGNEVLMRSADVAIEEDEEQQQSKAENGSPNNKRWTCIALQTLLPP